MTENTFRAGDRVRIPPDKADEYVQPWRNRIKKGQMVGVVVKKAQQGYAVKWDVPPRVKDASSWYWHSTYAQDLRKVQE
jgi:hypothetical protein